MSPTDTKRRLFICFSRLGKKVTKVCFSTGGIIWRFVMKICLIKRSTEVIPTQWWNFLQDPRIWNRFKWDKSMHCSHVSRYHTLRKHAYSNILKISQQKKTKKNWKFSEKKKSDIFFNIDCEYSLEPPCWGSSNEYPQSKFLSRNKKNNIYPCKPQFCYIKVGFKEGKNYIGMFSWCSKQRYAVVTLLGGVSEFF